MDFATLIISKFQTIGVPILVFGFLIAVHEYGHLLLARLVGVPVQEYAIGFGKSLFSWKSGGTVYKLNLIPLGGYCKILGMNPEEEDFDDPRGYNKQSGFKRFLILFGGPFFNLVSGVILAIAVFIYFGQPRALVALTPIKGGPAQEAGIKAGDLVLTVDGKPMESTDKLMAYIKASEGKTMAVEVAREGMQKTQIIPVAAKKFGSDYLIKAGLYPGPDLVSRKVQQLQSQAVQKAGLTQGSKILAINGIPMKTDALFTAYLATQFETLKEKKALVTFRSPGGEGKKISVPLFTKDSNGLMQRTFLTTATYEPMPLGESIKYSMILPYRLTVMQLKAIFSLFQGQTEGIGGPVAILGQVAQSAKAGLYQVLWISVLLNFAIAFFNLLPIPALDGGRIMFVMLEGLIRRRMNPIWETRINTVGMMGLLFLIALVTVRDLRNLFGF